MTGPDRRLRLVHPADREPHTGRVVGIANAGRPLHIGLSTLDARHHVHVLGPTGTGKSTLLLRLALQDAEAGRGLAVFDPSAKGDLITDVLDRLPADCADRLVIIDPAETLAPPAVNLLDPALAGSPYQVAAQLGAVMGRVWSRWWGPRMVDIAHHGLLTLAHTPGATLAQLPRLLADRRWRQPVVDALAARLPGWEASTLAQFWGGYAELPPGAQAAYTAPLLARLRLVLSHPLAQVLFGVATTTFRFADILDGAILLVRLPKGLVGEDGSRLIGSLLLASLWQAATSRANLPEAHRLDASIIVDEAQTVLHLPIGVDDALAEARGLHVGFVLAHQYMAQLPPPMVEAVDANARTKVFFTLTPRDAHDQARHVTPYLDEGDLARLGAHEIVLRPLSGGRVLPPSTANTLPPPPAIRGRGEALRAAARARTGLPTPPPPPPRPPRPAAGDQPPAVVAFPDLGPWTEDYPADRYPADLEESWNPTP